MSNLCRFISRAPGFSGFAADTFTCLAELSYRPGVWFRRSYYDPLWLAKYTELLDAIKQGDQMRLHRVLAV